MHEMHKGNANGLIYNFCIDFYFRQRNESEIMRLFPKAEVTYIANAGHWVHADKPYEFLDVVSNFLDEPEPRLLVETMTNQTKSKSSNGEWNQL